MLPLACPLLFDCFSFFFSSKALKTGSEMIIQNMTAATGDLVGTKL